MKFLRRKELPPSRIDYQGNERCEGYIRGVTNVPCQKCETTGRGDGRNKPWCDDCGGYGDVPPCVYEAA